MLIASLGALPYTLRSHRAVRAGCYDSRSTPPTQETPPTQSAASPKPEMKEDVLAKIVYPKSLAVLIVNSSPGDTLVREPTFTAVIWDLDLVEMPGRS